MEVGEENRRQEEQKKHKKMTQVLPKAVKNKPEKLPELPRILTTWKMQSSLLQKWRKPQGVEHSIDHWDVGSSGKSVAWHVVPERIHTIMGNGFISYTAVIPDG